MDELRYIRISLTEDYRFEPAINNFCRLSLENQESICVVFAYDDAMSASCLETEYFIIDDKFSISQFVDVCRSAFEKCDSPPWFSAMSFPSVSDDKPQILAIANDKFSIRILRYDISDTLDSDWHTTESNDITIEIPGFEPLFKIIRNKIVLSG